LNYLYKLFVIELGGMHGFIPICAGRFSGQMFKCHENIAARGQEELALWYATVF
jgi:hypothetical protein